MTARRRAPNAGFTLLEVLVVMALLGLLVGTTVRGIRSLARSDIKSASSRLSGAMRYLFDRASTTGKVHRLVLDFAEHKYWAEVSDDRYFLPRERETPESRIVAWKEEQEEAERRAEGRARGGRADEESGGQGTGLGVGFGSGFGSANSYDVEKYLPKPFKRKQARFQSFKETAIKPVTLKNAKLFSVYTPRLSEPIQEGKGYVYFFPLGYAEAAMVYLTDEDQEVTYSLVVHPLTGRVKIYNQYVEPPLETQVDDAGEVVDP